MQTLPKPLPDELLCSVLARATYRYGFWSPKHLLDLLYGRRSVNAVADLPCYLGDLVRVVGEHWQLGVEELAVRHTLFGYYTYFQHERQRKAVLAAMAAGGGSLHLRLGVIAGAARVPKFFHLCPQCHATDITRFGEAYWHRAHHLPGVLVCHLHGDPLRESDVPFRTPRRHVYQAAPIDINWADFLPLAGPLVRCDVALEVAVKSFELLCAQPGATSPRPDYRPLLERFGRGQGKAGVAKLQEAFQEYFGMDFLTSAFSRCDSRPLAWLVEVMRTPRRSLHPLKHVLMRVFIEGQVPKRESGRG